MLWRIGKAKLAAARAAVGRTASGGAQVLNLKSSARPDSAYHALARAKLGLTAQGDKGRKVGAYGAARRACCGCVRSRTARRFLSLLLLALLSYRDTYGLGVQILHILFAHEQQPVSRLAAVASSELVPPDQPRLL